MGEVVAYRLDAGDTRRVASSFHRKSSPNVGTRVAPESDIEPQSAQKLSVRGGFLTSNSTFSVASDESSRGRLCSRPLSHHRTCFIASGSSPRNGLHGSTSADILGRSFEWRRRRFGPLAESRQLHCLCPASSSSIRSILPSSPVPRAAQVPVLLDVRSFPMPSHRYYGLG